MPSGRIWFVGDPHGSFSHIQRTLDANCTSKPDALIFLGDQGCPRPFKECVAAFEEMGIKSYFVPGNHDADTYDNLRNLFHSQFSMERNLHGRVIEIAGLRIAGLVGVFRSKIWYPKQGDEEQYFHDYDEYLRDLNARRPTRLRRNVSKVDLLQGSMSSSSERQAEIEAAVKEKEIRIHLASIFPDDYNRLAAQKADILVTHEAPAPHPYGFQVLSDLGVHMGVQRSFHGHQHDNPHYPTHSYQKHGVGLRGISDELGNVILAGELDAAHYAQQGGLLP